MTDLTVTIRIVEPAEIGAESDAVRWVLSSWLRSYVDTARSIGLYRGTKDPWYWAAQHQTAMALIKRGRLVVAHLPGEPDLFVGWACAEPGVLHYVLTKSPHRHLGVAEKLVRAVSDVPISRYTHAGSSSLTNTANKHGWVYSPQLIAGLR